jgi:hypothetical protein
MKRMQVLMIVAGLSLPAMAQQPGTPAPGSLRERMNNTRSALDRGGAPGASAGRTVSAAATVAPTTSTAPTNPGQGLPWAIDGHQFTLTEINHYRARLDGQVVFVKLATTGIVRPMANGQLQVYVQDARSSGTIESNFAFVVFPPEGAGKMSLMGKNASRSLSFFVRVDGNALTAVGRSRNIDSFSKTFTYTW